ncbi:MAG TPA: hypothetical protein VGN26_14770 [Armatimonadota bacterium]
MALDLPDFVAEVSRQSGLPIEASPKLPVEVVTARLTKRSPREVINALRRLFGYKLWYRDKEAKYLLYCDDYDKVVAECKHRDLVEFAKRIQAAQDALRADPRLSSPSNVAQRLFVGLSKDQIAAITERQSVGIPFGKLSASDQGPIRAYLSGISYGRRGEEPRPPTEEEIAASRVTFDIDGEGRGLTLLMCMHFRTAKIGLPVVENGSGPDASPVGGASMKLRLTPFFGSEGREDAISQDEYNAAASSEDQAHVVSPESWKRRVSVKFSKPKQGAKYTAEAGTALSPTDDLYLALASQASQDFISDSLVSAPVEVEDLKGVALDVGLDRLCASTRYEWGTSGDLLLLRRAEWYIDAPSQIPATKCRRWVAFWRERARLADKPWTLAEFTAMAGDLSPAQLGRLGILVPPASALGRLCYPFVLNSKLLPAQQRQACTDEGVPLSEVPPEALKEFSAVMPEPIRRELQPYLAAPGARVRAVVTDGAIRWELTEGGQWTPIISIQRRFKDAEDTL